MTVFLLHELSKDEKNSNAGYWLLSENRKKKIKQSVLIAKNSLRKTRKMDNRQKLTPAKVSCTM